MNEKSVLAPVRARHHPSREEDGDGREQKLAQMKEPAHITVLKDEAVAQLSLQPSDVVVDATAGLGGHSEALLLAGAAIVYSLDADPAAVAAARERLAPFAGRSVVLEANFKDMREALASAGVTRINKALFDLGWNSTQMMSGRGFSFLRDEPLSMSFGTTPASGFTAAEIVNSWSEKVLADVFFGYGEERYARRIAKKIVEARVEKPIATTFDLVQLIEAAVPAAYRRGKIHPATRSFQALRIAVNDELGSLEKGLEAAWSLLESGGRIAVITFHSIEDRAVKRLFLSYAKAAGKLVVKKPLTASKEEITRNPRARSAKLRVIEKI